MSKKIMVLNGSPRKNGNTAALIESFIKGAESAGNTVDRFDLGQMNVHPCIGCLRGGKSQEGLCTQKDDMDKVYPAYMDADVVVLASPMYYWNFTAQLKMGIDRLFAVTEKLGKTPQKECVMLIAAEEDSESNFAPLVSYYKTITDNLSWKDLGMVLAGSVFEVGDIVGKPSLADAENLGASIC